MLPWRCLRTSANNRLEKEEINACFSEESWPCCVSLRSPEGSASLGEAARTRLWKIAPPPGESIYDVVEIDGKQEPDSSPSSPGMQVALDGAMTASLQAISRSAKHRLDRGIHTSSGAGDLRRARAAAERLCILAVREREGGGGGGILGRLPATTFVRTLVCLRVFG